MSDAKQHTESVRILANGMWRCFTAAAMSATLGAVAACSEVPDELNPVEWVEAVDEFVSGDDEPVDVRSQERIDSERGLPVPGEDESFPTLGSVPERPTDLSTYEERQALAESLVADRDNARYVDEPIAATDEIDTPWRTSGGVSDRAAAETSVPAPSSTSALPPPPDIGPPSSTRSLPPSPAIDAPSRTRALPAVPDTSDMLADTSPVYTPPPTTVGALPRPAPARYPSLPIEPPPVQQVPAWATSEQDYYQMFAASGGTVVAGSASGSGQIAAAPAYNAPSGDPSGPVGGGGFDTVEYSMHAAVIYYGHGSARLSDHDLEVLRQVAAAHQDFGGTIRIVGHASSRTTTNEVLEHKIANYEISVDRARGVAQALIRMGVPSQSVFVDALADSAPQFSEGTPMGEAANRRADIYLDFWRQHS